MQRVTLAQITRRVELLLETSSVLVKPFLADLIPEEERIAVLLDGSDKEGMEIYGELGFQHEVPAEGVLLFDILSAPFDRALRAHDYIPIDEVISCVPGTVLLIVLTMGVAVGRRFAAGSMAEVKCHRDIELKVRGGVEGEVALEIIVQSSARVLRELWDGGNDRVALIMQASHGAKVGYVNRAGVIGKLRETSIGVAEKDRRTYRYAEEALAGGPRPGMVPFIIHGWGIFQFSLLAIESLAARPGRYFDDQDQARLLEFIPACRDRQRTLGLLEKRRSRVSLAAASAALAELIALAYDRWEDCDAILAKTREVLYALVPSECASPEGQSLRAVLIALMQATNERKRGGVVNARGGRA